MVQFNINILQQIYGILYNIASHIQIELLKIYKKSAYVDFKIFDYNDFKPEVY